MTTQTALDRLDATRLTDGRYAYHADETRTYYVVDEAEIALLAEMMADPDVQDAYSEWCAISGEEADVQVLRELGVDVPVTCECGTATGVSCEWSGPRDETVLVEWMPEQHRESHRAARNSGTYPANGAVRLRVSEGCADLLLETDGEWTTRVSA